MYGVPIFDDAGAVCDHEVGGDYCFHDLGVSEVLIEVWVCVDFRIARSRDNLPVVCGSP